jgi:hypothetical protein
MHIKRSPGTNICKNVFFLNKATAHIGTDVRVREFNTGLLAGSQFAF